jgi:hypothetical protein
MPGVFFKARPDPEEKMLGQHHVEHMPVPGRPGSMLVMVHAKMAFAFFKTLFDRPALA